MPFQGTHFFGGEETFYNGAVSASARFDTGSSTLLTKTPDQGDSLKTWTWAAWVKRSKLGVERAIWSVGNTSVDFALFFHTTDQLRVWTTSGAAVYYTSRVFRDVGSWFHVAITSNNSSPYIRLYINGVLNTTSSFDDRTSVPGSNNLSVNTNAVHRIGAWNNGGLQYFDGYLADIYHIDGTAVGDTGSILDEFIEIKNGVCIPKKYTGSYGSNGYHLEFKQTGTGTASTTTIGADTSGNTNHYTSSGLDASDSNMPDCPENNFPTMNVVNTNTNLNLSEGSLKLIPANTSDYYRSMSTMATPKTGKWYWEVRLFVASYVYIFGLYDIESKNNQRATTIAGDAFSGTNDYQVRTSNSLGIDISAGGAAFSDWLGTNIASGDIVSFAYDADNNKLWFALNGTFQNTSGTANPATGDDPRFSSITSTEYYLGANMPNPASGGAMFNFGQDSSFAGAETAQGNADGNGIGDFYYSPPSGYLALCSSNLPDVTIGPVSDTQASDHFNTLLYTGDGTSTHAITGNGFKPDMVWQKARTQSHDHFFMDSNRGATRYLKASVDSPIGEVNAANFLKSFDTDGVTVGDDGVINNNTSTYVMWNWKANGGTTATDSNGDITSTVQVNSDAGFSIVTFTGDGNNGSTVGHGLAGKPGWVLIKDRDTNSVGHWMVHHKDFADLDNNLFLNLNNALNNAGFPSGSDPTGTTTFEPAVKDYNNVSGNDYVAYVWKEIEGYSKFGTYTGNGNADGAFVFTGFRPAWFMHKRTNSAENWHIIDSARNPTNKTQNVIFADTGDAETVYSSEQYDILSNGVKLRNTGGSKNGSGDTYIYMAFAEVPFKFANAR